MSPPRRRINAREVVSDIKSGMSDFLLMQKYALSSKGLQSLFRKLLAAGLIGRSDLSEEARQGEDSIQLDSVRCPACGMPQFGSFDECPQCGIIVSKFRSRLTRIEKETNGTGTIRG